MNTSLKYPMITHTIPGKDSSVYEFDITSNMNFEQLKVDILNLKKDFPISRKSSINSWHSDFFTHVQCDKFSKLTEIMESCAGQVGDTFTESIIKSKFLVKESWAIIYNKYGHTDEHSHSPLSLAAICYVSAEKCPGINFGDFTIPINTGKLLIFPGYLKHHVPMISPKHSDRIVYVGNLYPVLDFSEIDRKVKALYKLKE